jgi:hypothetical protein
MVKASRSEARPEPSKCKARQGRQMQMKTRQSDGLAKNGYAFTVDRQGEFGGKASQVEDRGKEWQAGEGLG